MLCVWNDKFDSWGLPGGKEEPGEGLFRTQSRELEEETSLVTLIATPFYYGPGSADPSVQVHVFLVAALGEPIENESGRPVAWFFEDALCEFGKPFAPFYQEMFRQIHAGNP